MMNKSINIQDTFLNQLRKDSIPVTVYLTNGFQIRGQIRAFDNFTIVIDSEGRQQMVYKHAIHGMYRSCRKSLQIINIMFMCGVTFVTF
jgi:host factor-I protein